MTWALGDDPGSQRLMEYESKLNYFFPENDVVAICQYNRTRFRPEVLIDVIYTHPLVIFGNLVCRNFYYFPPDEFRKSDRTSIELKRLLKNLIDREEAEEVLRESDTELKESQRVAQVGSWRWIVASDTITWSPGYYRIIGRDPSLPPPNYREHLKMYTYESAARLEAAVAESLKNGTPYELDLELLHPDGSRRFMIARGEAVREAAGQVVMLRGTLQDITERKRAEEEIRKLNAELEQRVRDRTDELEKKNAELERMNRLFVGRELRMIELKKRIAELERKIESPQNTKRT